MKKNTCYLISLGCAKNSVDTDSMAQLLLSNGYQQVDDEKEAEFLIVNTCGFVSTAREESYQVLQELASIKRKQQKLIVCGCLTQRYSAQVAQRVAGIDGIIGTRRWMDILPLIESLRTARTKPSYRDQTPNLIINLNQASLVMEAENIARVSMQGKSAYLKIADGCRRKCAFCAIPSIKGSLVSRSIEHIIADARGLQQQGIQEIILIAQDTTDYGHDLGMKDGLVLLLQSLTVAVPDIPWIRILYTFPGYISDALIDLMAHQRQILPYLDIPLQHAHPITLKRMGRPTNIDGVHRTLEKVRRAIPEVVLRTTFIVGYPGESETEFNTLLEFVEETRFDKVGAFQFSFEEGTPSEPLGDPIPSEVKQARWEQLMALQQRISLEKNQALVGKTLQVLIEGAGEVEGSQALLLVGRSYRDAPEIDGLVLVEGASTSLDGIVLVRINSALAYDLVGNL